MFGLCDWWVVRFGGWGVVIGVFVRSMERWRD